MNASKTKAPHHKVRDASVERIDVRRLAEAGLEPPPLVDMSANDIRALRERHNISQAALAKLLGTGVGAVRQWEQGGRHPAGTALKLLNMLQRDGIGVLL